MGISLENFTIISDIGGYRFHISLEDCFNPSYSLTYNVYRVMGELHGDKVIEREMGKLDTDSRDFLGLSAFVSKYGRGLEQVIFGKECAMEVYNGLVVFKFNRLSGLDKTIINGYKLRDESEEFILKEKDLRRNKRFFERTFRKNGLRSIIRK